jgi:hypothetical protein
MKIIYLAMSVCIFSLGLTACGGGLPGEPGSAEWCKAAKNMTQEEADKTVTGEDRMVFVSKCM